MVSEEDKVGKLLRDPSLHKKLLLQFLPHITDTLIGAVNNIDTEGSSTREKRSLSTEKLLKPQNLYGMLIKSIYLLSLQLSRIISDYLEHDNILSSHSFLAEPKTRMKRQDAETLNFFGLELERASGRVWKKAFEKSLDEQNMYNTAASGLVKGVLRWVAWIVFAVGVHGPDHLFSY